jgi:hypothetical protein
MVVLRCASPVLKGAFPAIENDCSRSRPDGERKIGLGQPGAFKAPNYPVSTSADKKKTKIFF